MGDREISDKPIHEMGDREISDKPIHEMGDREISDKPIHEMGDREISEEPQSPPKEQDTGRFSFSAIYNYLLSQQYPEGASKLEKNALRRRAKYFRVRNYHMYYVGGAKTPSPVAPRLVVEDLEQRKRIVANIHNTSHLGLNRTNDMVASKYYWPGLFKDVRTYVSC